MKKKCIEKLYEVNARLVDKFGVEVIRDLAYSNIKHVNFRYLEENHVFVGIDIVREGVNGVVTHPYFTIEIYTKDQLKFIFVYECVDEELSVRFVRVEKLE